MPANKIKKEKGERHSSTKKKGNEESSKFTLPERPKLTDIPDGLPERPKKRFKDKYESAEILKANSGGMACKKCGAMSCSCGGMAKKYNKGGMVRGTGKAITGKGFKGVF